MYFVRFELVIGTDVAAEWLTIMYRRNSEGEPVGVAPITILRDRATS